MPANTPLNQRPTITEVTETPCRKCRGTGLFDNGRTAGDCFPCGGGGFRLRHRPMNDAELAAHERRWAEYLANSPAEQRRLERAARRAEREAAAQTS